jgi:hypothetical protein
MTRYGCRGPASVAGRARVFTGLGEQRTGRARLCVGLGGANCRAGSDLEQRASRLKRAHARMKRSPTMSSTGRAGAATQRTAARSATRGAGALVGRSVAPACVKCCCEACAGLAHLCSMLPVRTLSACEAPNAQRALRVACALRLMTWRGRNGCALPQVGVAPAAQRQRGADLGRRSAHLHQPPVSPGRCTGCAPPTSHGPGRCCCVCGLVGCACRVVWERRRSALVGGRVSCANFVLALSPAAAPLKTFRRTRRSYAPNTSWCRYGVLGAASLRCSASARLAEQPCRPQSLRGGLRSERREAARCSPATLSR